MLICKIVPRNWSHRIQITIVLCQNTKLQIPSSRVFRNFRFTQEWRIVRKKISELPFLLLVILLVKEVSVGCLVWLIKAIFVCSRCNQIHQQLNLPTSAVCNTVLFCLVWHTKLHPLTDFIVDFLCHFNWNFEFCKIPRYIISNIYSIFSVKRKGKLNIQ